MGKRRQRESFGLTGEVHIGYPDVHSILVESLGGRAATVHGARVRLPPENGACSRSRTATVVGWLVH